MSVETETNVLVEKDTVSRGRRLDKVIMHHLLVRVVWLFYKLYGRMQVVGLENVPREGGLIFASNHASFLDPPMGWIALYGIRRVYGIARDTLWKNAFVGYMLECMGVLPVKRKSADRGMLRLALDVLKRGDTLGIFPEGTRTPDGKLHSPQPGIAFIVKKSGAPVIPVAMLGTFVMLPRKAKNLRRHPLKIAFGKPLLFPKEATREEITSAVMVEIANLMTANGVPTEPPSDELSTSTETSEE